MRRIEGKSMSFGIGWGMIAVVLALVAAGPVEASVLNSCVTYCHRMPPKDGTRKGNLHFDSRSSAFGGSHSTHALGTVSTCERCHPGASGYSFGHMTSAAKPVIKVGSNINNSPATGAYNKAGVKATFFNQTSLPVLGSCSNVNCHFNSATDTWGTAPYATADTTSCAKCHGAPPATGNHAKHVTVFGGTVSSCARCHPDHAAESAKFQHATSAAAGHRNLIVVPGSGAYGTGRTVYPNYLPSGSGSYASCTNVYCHSTVQGGGTTGGGAPSAFGTVAWGGAALSCGSCHADESGLAATGSHALHAGTTGNGQYACATCHNGTVPPVQEQNHADGNINLSFSTPTQLTAPMVQATQYSNGSAFSPSAAYGSCSNTSCHGSGSPTWGANTTRVSCEKCHGSAATVPFYATNAATATSDAKAGAHTNHLNATSSGHNITGNIACTECHTVPATVNTLGHFSSASLITFGTLTKSGGGTPSFTRANRTCSATYCHGATLVGGSKTSPVWNTPFLTGSAANDCATCHGYPPPEGPHLPTKLPTECAGCHPNVNAAGTGFINPALHINGTIDVNSNCDSCHGYPPASAGFVGTSGNWSSAHGENYAGGGGAHTINAHVKKGARPSEGWANCQKCHNPADHVMSPLVWLPSSNIKVRVNSVFAYENLKFARYTSNRLDAANHVTGTCSNINCHFGASPKWDPLH
ncbi:CxxxxCH/CxxCH domain c-type cytochrome [Geomesophilobacter sediminis]|uniref:CxxxxCH/CxxCH domain-containing protein n=1 Tax=Geomesophilobacter sediminis TaxID=2798584 RepID=A0A8J7IR99_9BACT|nr:CxxxxCH/CxxCH domain-containing protein [Geomesophilobacter sediminis]MBJ6725374.1 CxxxxCH/CxxCH domain-containing protein [Geomesophilobacter sediminis]